MSESRNPDAADDPRDAPDGESATPGGYEYTVVGDDAPSGLEGQPRGEGPRVPVVAALAGIIVALIVGAGVAWGALALLDDDGGGGGDAHVTNVVSAFSQGQGAANSRSYEGQLPPGWPDEVPAYPGARVISSTRDVLGGDVSYLAIYGTGAARSSVAGYFSDAFSESPWQIEAGRDTAGSTLYTFARTDTADVSGLVIMTESDGDGVTTIIVNVQIVGGAAGVEDEPYAPGAARALPAGFPDDFPLYPDATVVETLFDHQPAGSGYAVSFDTDDAPADVLDFYDRELAAAGWTVEDDADFGALTFEGNGGVEGQLQAYDLEGADVTRVDVQIRQARGGG